MENRIIEKFEYRRKDGRKFLLDINLNCLNKVDKLIYQCFLKDVTNYYEINKHLNKNLDFTTVITSLVSKFINADIQDLDPLINNILKKAALFSNVDRSYVFKFSRDLKKIDNIYEWVNDGIESQINKLKNLSTRDYTWWVQKLKENKCICFKDIKNMPLEAKHERELLESQNIKSIIVVPLTKKGELFGFLGFDSVLETKDWDDYIKTFLELIGEIIINALDKKNIQNQLYHSNINFKTLFDSIDDLMVIIDKEGKIIQINEKLLKKIGYNKKDMIGKKFYALHPKRYKKNALQRFNKLLQGTENNYNLPLISRDGNEIPADTKVNLGKWWGKDVIFEIARDVTEQKKYIELLKKAYNEKQLLLKEIHHRVKNNLQFIISLINLQLNKGDNENHKETIEKCKHRIKLISLLYEKLYISKDFSKINFGEHIKNIINYLSEIYYPHFNNIKINVNITGIYLNINTAIPCSLIINELVANSLRHAFDDNSDGIIEISMDKKDNTYTLIVSDNGFGISGEIVDNSKKGLGLKLVNILVKQLSGKIYFSNDKLTKFTIKFKKNEKQNKKI